MIGMPSRRQLLPRAPSLQRARTGWREVTNRASAGRVAARCHARGPLPSHALIVYFAGEPSELYQVTGWLTPLRRLDLGRPLGIMATRADAAAALLELTDLPVALVRGSADLERVVREHDVRVVFYVNHRERNFRMLRFAGPVHVYLGHGESDKDSSYSNQNKAYDRVFVAGSVARDRLQAHLRGFDVEERAPMVGRPQLDVPSPGGPPWSRDGRLRVLYAPTWEGDRPSMAYGSVASHGLALVRALCADPDVRVIYRPHPQTGRLSSAAAAADAAIRRELAGYGDRHLVDVGPYGWQWAFADACVTDLSAAAYDWLPTGKPLVVTRPADRRARLPHVPLLEAVPLLDRADTASAPALLRELAQTPDPRLTALATRYFGDTAPGASMQAFRAAVGEALRLQANEPPGAEGDEAPPTQPI